MSIAGRRNARSGARAHALLLLVALLLTRPAAADPLAAEPETPLAAAAAAETPPPAPEAEARAADEAYDPLFDDDEPPEEYSDPIEGTNRAVLSFNEGVDRVFWRPVSQGVRKVVPAPARQAVGNALWNLDSVSIFVNDVLQGRPRMAGRTFARLLINTTVGLGGLMDPAAAIGLERRESDFGTTLGHYGVGPGPYLMVPFAGPATVRDGFGGVVDSLMNPLTYLIGPGGDLILGVLFLNFGRGIAMQERHRVELEAMREGSVDYYATLRSVYMQSREAALRELDEHHYPPGHTAARPTGGGPRLAALARSPGGPSKLRRHRSP
ncbi:MAG: VacJ family lipoprotein [Myxococcota bacterium]|nr:VacJ family lipoprotein [Myxococcota bacterium]